MLYGLNGIRGLDPKKEKGGDHGDALSGYAGFRLEALSAAGGIGWQLSEIEMWTGAGYTGTKFTGAAYATSANASFPAANAFDGNGGSLWACESPASLGVLVGVVGPGIAAPQVSSWVGGGDAQGGFSFFLPEPKSFRLVNASGSDRWVTDFRLDVLKATLRGDVIGYTWHEIRTFFGIAYPGSGVWWGTDL